jgi:hypothetical protein
MAVVQKKSTRSSSYAKLDLRNPDYAKNFKAAAKAFSKKAEKSPEYAMAVLVEAGIYTPTGRLTKNYR